MKKTIGLDFDGVIHLYNEGWKGIRPTEGPVPGARRAIAKLREDFEVVVFSTRCTHPKGPRLIEQWLAEHRIEVDDVVTDKPKAVLMVDDRGFRFEGDWSKVVEFVKGGAPEPWNRDRPEEPASPRLREGPDSLDLENLFTYHPPKGNQTERYERLRLAGKRFAQEIADSTLPGPDQSAAIRKVREAVFTANAAIACGE